MIALITPTGSRPQQFDMCAMWMKNQTYTGEVVWIIVDDAYPRSTDQVKEGFRDKLTLVKVYPTPLWSGQNTQARNIKAGTDALIANFKDIEAVFIIEDDDYYKPNYLERMMARKANFDLWGEVNTVYYNVALRKYAANNNLAHVSLFQTAFTMKTLPELERCYFHKFIDCVLWTLVPNKLLFYENTLSIGMKGMPGRGGIGAGHKGAFVMSPDYSMSWLKSQIGSDAQYYERFFTGVRNNSNPLFAKR